MNSIGWLTLILLILIAWIGKAKGVKAFISFFLNFSLILLFIYLVALGINSVFCAVLIGILSSCVNLFFYKWD